MDMLVMYTISHAVINKSHEEHMDKEHGKQLLKWEQGWAWGHYAHLVQARDSFKRFAHLCAEQRQAKERVC